MSVNYTRLMARDALVSDIHNTLKDDLVIDGLDKAELIIYGDNGPKKNLDNYRYVIEYSVDFNNTEQADINPNPTMRQSGVIVFVVGVREGGGSRVPLAISDFLHQRFRRKWLGKVRVENPRDVGPYELRAWKFLRIDVPFRFDAKDFIN